MAGDNQIPSVNPADLDSIAGAVQFIVRKILQQTDDMLPATVIAYDRTTNMATVQPMIKVKTTGNELVSRAPLAQVPVFSFGGGTFLINFPLNPGDTGWIKASDRDISLYLQGGYVESAPNSNRIHSFSDALFFPDAMANYTLDPTDAAALVIQDKTGAVKISVSMAAIKLQAPVIDILGPLSVLGAALAHFTGSIQVDGSANITGDTAITGKFGANGQPAQGKVTLTDYPASTTAEVLSLVNQLAALLIANGQAQ